jgi:hypothetical protein
VGKDDIESSYVCLVEWFSIPPGDVLQALRRLTLEHVGVVSGNRTSDCSIGLSSLQLPEEDPRLSCPPRLTFNNRLTYSLTLPFIILSL